MLTEQINVDEPYPDPMFYFYIYCRNAYCKALLVTLYPCILRQVKFLIINRKSHIFE